MSFPVSPGVAFREIDASAVVQQISTSNGVIAGKFTWGPVNQITRVSGEDLLKLVFGKPTDAAYLDYMVASSFLAYSSALDVVRIGSHTTTMNANDAGLATISVLNRTDYEAQSPAVTYLAKYPGIKGNGLQVQAVGLANQFSYTLPGTFAFSLGRTATYTPADDAAIAGTLLQTLDQLVATGDVLVIGGVSYTVAGVVTNTVTFTSVYTGSTSITAAVRQWKYASLFGTAPTTGEFLLVVVDTAGTFGIAGEVLEYFRVSTTVGAKNDDGSTKYYKDVLSQDSSYILAGATVPAFATNDNLADVYNLTGGLDGFTGMTPADYITGYDLFKDTATADAALIIASDAFGVSSALPQYLIQNIAEVRKDAVVFVSPQLSSKTAASVVTDRNTLGSSSYATMDSGWKYMYDRYNNKNRWVPLNGDIAGLYAAVDTNLDPWYSAGGVVNGRIKNCIKLQFNPTQSDRDVLYVAGVNPVTSFPGVGPVLYGNKTLLNAATAFNRMNTRRLFIVLEKTISTYAAQLLFQFNNEFTQRKFTAQVEPFLRDVKGRQGIDEFLIVADSSVNTPQVVQSNQFVGQIFLKPSYVAEFIRLDFVAVNASTSFSEVIVGL